LPALPAALRRRRQRERDAAAVDRRHLTEYRFPRCRRARFAASAGLAARCQRQNQNEAEYHHAPFPFHTVTFFPDLMIAS
jgi:hypothetical protein